MAKVKEPERKNIMYDTTPDEDGVIRVGDCIMARSAIRLLLNDGNGTMRGVSRKMGRNDNYLAITLAKSSRPGLELVAEVADILGYDLQIVNRETGESIGHVGYIDPATRKRSEK